LVRLTDFRVKKPNPANERDMNHPQRKSTNTASGYPEIAHLFDEYDPVVRRCVKIPFLGRQRKVTLIPGLQASLEMFRASFLFGISCSGLPADK